MTFMKYQHVERFDNEEVEGILNGRVYVFEKIDGTNASIWNDENGLHFGSRRCELNEKEDNRAFYRTFAQDDRFIRFFHKYPDIRLFGEYLVPHQVRYYKKDAWNKFYVFDVVRLIPEVDLENQYEEHFQYLPYEEYKEMLDEFGIDYIPVIDVFDNPSKDDIISCLDKTTFLSDVPGEGVVCKNYSYRNRFGRTKWAKIVREEFLTKKIKNRAKRTSNDYDEVIDTIIRNYVSESFIYKEQEKLNNAFEMEGKNRFSPLERNQYIGRLLEGTYKTFLEEETYNIVKKLCQPTIDYRRLKRAFTDKIKEVLPDVFVIDKNTNDTIHDKIE